MTRTQKANETDSHERDDIDPSDTGGVDDDDPDDKDGEAHGELEAGFKLILWIVFQIKDKTNHKVFESLQHEGIYSWGLFIDNDSPII